MSSPMSAPTTSPPPLRPPGNELDRRVIACWRVVLGLSAAVPVVVLVLLAVLIPPAAAWFWIAAVLVAVLGALGVMLLPPWWYRMHRWEYTPTAVYVRSGYLWQKWRFAPLSRIQTVDTKRGPVQQRFGLATVTVTTASAQGPVRMTGLDAGLAADVAHRLTDETQATPGDAT